MAKDKPVEADVGDCPAWFMTYSDVITLLMTFFILLMTFATNEPERFERMQVSMFGGSGATGVAGEESTVEHDALLLRQRPRSSRMTMRGSETAPISKDAASKSLGKGLEGLDGPQKFDPSRSFIVEMRHSDVFNSSGAITREAKQHFYNASKRVSNGKLRATVRSAPEHLERCMMLAEFMNSVGKLNPSDVGVGAWLSPKATTHIQLELLQLGGEKK